MNSIAGKTLFRLALALSLISICLSAYVLMRAQSGPSWEVPAAVVRELATIPVMSIALVVGAVLLYLWSSRLGNVAAGSQSGFWIASVAALIFPLSIRLLQPEQWPFRYATLSFVAASLFVPVMIASLIFFWLIGFRWLKAGGL
jgi:hypothetical protein